MNGSNVFTFLSPTKVYLGIDSHKTLKEIIADLEAKHLFLLSDKGVAATEMFNLVEDTLRENHVTFEVFTDIDPEPTDKTVEKAYEIYRTTKASTLLALGGGSTIDVGKAVGILATNGGGILDYVGNDKFSNPPLPLIAIPTTAGTGSEVSGSCAITDTTRNAKISIRSAALNPAKVAILDPMALRSLPAPVAAHAGVDAFTHALESYVCLNANPITDALNIHAIELIAHNIKPFVSNRSNLDAGLKMLCAANIAAMGFTNTGLGNIHCVARFIAAFFHISHGLSTAVWLPYVAEFNLVANPEKFARIALAMGERIHGLTTIEAGKKAIEAIKQLNRELGIPQKLRDVGVTEDKLPEMARLSFEAGYNRLNPRHTTHEDFLALFEEAF
jgi:alcohol dehydrogenase